MSIVYEFIECLLDSLDVHEAQGSTARCRSLHIATFTEYSVDDIEGGLDPKLSFADPIVPPRVLASLCLQKRGRSGKLGSRSNREQPTAALPSAK